MPRKPHPVEWNGIQYPSMKEAARQLGVDDGTVRYRHRMGYRCDDDLMLCAERQKRRVRPKQFIWDGIEYRSITKAAEANGMSYAAMRFRVLKGYRCDDDMLGHNSTIKVETEWNGIKYESISEAARANGMSFGGMQHRLRSGYTCDDDMKRPRK